MSGMRGPKGYKRPAVAKMTPAAYATKFKPSTGRTILGPKQNDIFRSRMRPRIGKSRNTYSNKPKPIVLLGSRFDKSIKTKEGSLSYFDSTKTSNQETTLALPNSLNIALVQNFTNRDNFSIGTSGVGAYTIYIFTMTGSQCIGIKYATSATTAVATAVYTPLLYPDFATTPPTTLRSSRTTIGLSNSTAATNVAGTVTVLMTSSNLEFEFDPLGTQAVSVNFQNEINLMLNSNVKSKTYTSADFVKTVKFSLVPISMQACEEWVPFADFSAYSIAQKNAFLVDTVNHASHSTLIIRFDAPSVANSYVAQYSSQYSTRHSPNSLLGSMGRHNPIMSEATFVKLANHALRASPQGEHSSTYYGPDSRFSYSGGGDE